MSKKLRSRRIDRVCPVAPSDVVGCPTPIAVGVGFEPTEGGPSLAFEASPFGRFGTPPWRFCERRLTPAFEEGTQQFGRLVRQNAGRQLELVVQPRVLDDVVERIGRAGGRVLWPIDETRD